MGGYAAYREQCPFEQKYGLYETIRLSNIRYNYSSDISFYTCLHTDGAGDCQ